MCRRSSLSARLIAALIAAPALLLFAASAALAQSKPAAAEVKAMIGPKQVGPWHVVGWGRGGRPSHCTAERRLQSVPDDGGALQFALVRLPDAYRILLSSNEWTLNPGAVYPVELIAPPILRSDASAVAMTRKAVIIELGGDTAFMQKLATAPTLAIKTARTVYRLPLEGLGLAIGEVDYCVAAINLGSNAVAGPARTGNHDVVPTPAQEYRVSEPRTEAGLIEERTFLTVRDNKGSYRLEALLVRPAQAPGRLPIALITHGKNLTALENESFHADIMLPQARDFAARGWLAVAVMRRGYGASDGVPGVSRGAAYMACGGGDLARGFEVEADDLAGALQAVSARPDADASRALAVGQSFGGGIVLAFASRQPAGLLGVVNVSGGVWRQGSNGDVCDFDALIAAMETFGGRARVPALWLYAENDRLFSPEVVRRMHEAYVAAGGRAELKIFPPVAKDGHALFADLTGRTKWLPALDAFLLANRMPNTNVVRLEEVKRAPRLAPFKREFLEQYLAMPTPKVLAVSPNGTEAYWYANSSGIEAARNGALGRCREKAGRECTIVMENDDLVRPMVTSAAGSNVTAR